MHVYNSNTTCFLQAPLDSTSSSFAPPPTPLSVVGLHAHHVFWLTFFFIEKLSFEWANRRNIWATTPINQDTERHVLRHVFSSSWQEGGVALWAGQFKWSFIELKYWHKVHCTSTHLFRCRNQAHLQNFTFYTWGYVLSIRSVQFHSRVGGGWGTSSTDPGDQQQVGQRWEGCDGTPLWTLMVSSMAELCNIVRWSSCSSKDGITKRSFTP